MKTRGHKEGDNRHWWGLLGGRGWEERGETEKKLLATRLNTWVMKYLYNEPSRHLFTYITNLHMYPQT